MAALHESLKSLSPVAFDSVPADPTELSSFLRKHFSTCQLLIDSVPPPPPPPDSDPYEQRNRSHTTSSTASGVSDILQSALRSELPIAEHEQLQKEWGKPLKLSSKENPLGISVYKLSGKDGKGAWFARRSVHEGLSFDKWKSGLEKEFPESVDVEGGPGAGKVRGIGGEKLIERLETDRGTMEGKAVCSQCHIGPRLTRIVYHLSAQFPGPSAPRDFVTLLLTSEYALGEGGPRHYMIISKPCEHKDCPQRDGFVRGQYESVEFIREVPLLSKQAASTVDQAEGEHSIPTLTDEHAKQRQSKSGDAVGRNSQENSKAGGLGNGTDMVSSFANTSITNPERSRDKTISFAESGEISVNGQMVGVPPDESSTAETNPVEWVMITRSDPGGSVPRFMVERGTPSGIVADAGKFLDWACKNISIEEGVISEQQPNLGVSRMNGQTVDPDGAQTLPHPSQETMQKALDVQPGTPSGSFLTNMTNAAYAAYAAMTEARDPPSSLPSEESLRTSRSSSVSSSDSFASAEDYPATPSVLSSDAPQQLKPHEKEALKLDSRKSGLNAKLNIAREKAVKNKEAPTNKETASIAKLEEKHGREIAKAEGQYAKAILALDNKKKREEKKEADRKAKMEKKEEEKRIKAEKAAERAGSKAELELLKAERDLLQETVRQLHAENTKLVTLMGKMEGGESLLQELKADGKSGLGSSSSLKSASGIAGEGEP